MTAPAPQSQQNTAELSPCPFCGGTDIKALAHLDWVACDNCGASLEDAEPSARELWNRHALPAAKAAGDETRFVTEEDRQYASELLADLNSDDLPKLEIAARWFRKARVEQSLPSHRASGDVRAAVIEITDSMVKAGAAAMCCQAETLGCAAKKASSEFQTCMLSTFMQDARRCLEAALSQSPATDAAVLREDLEYHARFLLDRLQEFDPGDFEAEREFHGHVAPAIARLRNALGVA